MTILELFLIGVGLSMDAFAASVCKGLNMKKINWRQSLIIALFFGGFQALMPLIGWGLGRQFEHLITSYDHWIAFVLLCYIGGKMIWDVCQGEGETCPVSFSLRDVLLLAIATSIDALAVGITFAFLKVVILQAIVIIGCTTFALSLSGVFLGHRFGVRYKSKAELAGGVILILIGSKILLEHLGIW